MSPPSTLLNWLNDVNGTTQRLSTPRAAVRRLGQVGFSGSFDHSSCNATSKNFVFSGRLRVGLSLGQVLFKHVDQGMLCEVARICGDGAD